MKEALNISSNNKRKGIILAGGTGSRLYPITKSISKQLIPIYDKPMVYYPLSTLMLAGIRNILIITTPNDKELFEKLLGDGSELGLKINYKEQEYPKGIAQAFLIAEEFLDNTCCALILGDNIFHGDGFLKELRKVSLDNSTSSIFAYRVNNPEAFGVIDFDQYGNVTSIEEKPQNPKTSYVVTGLYFYDEKVVDYAKTLKPSTRGELEITDLNKIYLKNNNLKVNILGRGMAWLDTGTSDSLHDASSYIRTLELRQGLKVSCPEEIAWRNKWISDRNLEKLAIPLKKSGYGKYLLDLLRD